MITFIGQRGRKRRDVLTFLFHNHDIDIRVDRRKYKNVIIRSNNPLKQAMKNLMNVRHNQAHERLMLFGVFHELLL